MAKDNTVIRLCKIPPFLSLATVETLRSPEIAAEILMLCGTAIN